MEPDRSRIQVSEELLLAKQSRLEGNEGRARVCARRAAGAAVKGFLEEQGLVSGSENILNCLTILKDSYQTPQNVEAALGWLLQRVDQDYQLPEGIDLVQEAKVVLEFLDEQIQGTTP